MSATTSFEQLGLNRRLVSAITDLGYQNPTTIQEQSIPVLMDGKDLLAQAQTGTGKTAAFALPILSHIDNSNNKPQALIIAPTREIAIQVAQAFKEYAQNMKGVHVTPIYGGQDYKTQLKALKRGTHIVVGTPGRIMDHIDRGTLKLNSLNTIVLDEADEMLKMGFIDDVEWILEHIPQDHQTALFSATMPEAIQKIAKRYLDKQAERIYIKAKNNTVDAIEQLYMRVANKNKFDALTRFLEIEDMQAAIIFARTKQQSSELAEKLQGCGYSAAALNGDMNQSARKQVIERIKKGSLDIVVATDVAARGIDVERISHVFNYDIPFDTESYIHRIGRTGRAGRKGKAFLFVTPNERRLLTNIEQAIHKSIKQVQAPSLAQLKDKRNKQFSDKIINVINKSKHLKPYREMVEDLVQDQDCAPKDIAAALAYLMQQDSPLPMHDGDIAEPAFEKKPSRPRKSKGKKHNKAKFSSHKSKTGRKPHANKSKAARNKGKHK